MNQIKLNWMEGNLINQINTDKKLINLINKINVCKHIKFNVYTSKKIKCNKWIN